MLLPAIRSLTRGILGQRPHQRDLELIIERMRTRLAHGGHLRPPALSWISPERRLRHLRALQLRKLRNTVRYARQHIPFYQRAARNIESLADLERIPLTRRKDLQADPPAFVSRAPGLAPAIRMTTSGTTGAPIECLLTNAEFEYYTAIQAITGMSLGFLGPSRIAQVHLPLDLSLAAQIYTAAARKAGTLVLNLGLASTLDNHLDSLLQERVVRGTSRRVTDLYAAPGYLWALTARSLQLRIDPSRVALRRVFSAGATVSRELKDRVKTAWGVRLFEGYSLMETPGTGAFECDHGRLHFVDASALVEFLHPETGEPVAPGDCGIAVITTFFPDRELMPLLRYWTDDLMQTPSDPLCPCGNVATSVEAILGRQDQMVTVGGQNYYPQPIGDVLTAFPELAQPPRFSLHAEQQSDAECAVVSVECASSQLPRNAAHLSGQIRSALPLNEALHVRAGVVKLEVRLMPAGSLSDPFKYKLQAPQVIADQNAS